MNENKLSNQQIVLYKDVEFGSTAFVNAFRYVDEPIIQFSTSISCLYVVPDVIGGKFSDLGMDFISSEIVVFNVS